MPTTWTEKKEEIRSIQRLPSSAVKFDGRHKDGWLRIHLEGAWPYLGVEPVGDGERRVDPAVRVHDVAGHALDDAVDGIADILA